MSLLSLPVSTLGVPRIGPRRELKAALESYWSGKSDAANLLESAAGLRAANWARQRALGVTNIPSNDFSLYDHVLDTSVMVGAIPEIYGWTGGPVPLETYFAMARGSQGDNHDAACAHGQEGDAHGVPALEMTKWFDTNYHYMVPEFTKGQRFTLASTKPVDEYREAKALGYHTRPVLLGPVTYLKLGKSKDPTLDPLSLLGGLLPVYVDVLRAARRERSRLGADRRAVPRARSRRRNAASAARSLRHGRLRAADAEDHADHLFRRARATISTSRSSCLSPVCTSISSVLPASSMPSSPRRRRGLFFRSASSTDAMSGGRTYPAILDRLEPVVAKRGLDHVEIAPSCSLLHVPIDLELETGLDPDLKSWLAFSVQKMEELATLGKALVNGREAVIQQIADSAVAAATRAASPKVHDAAVAARVAAITPDMARRTSPFDVRRQVQHEALNLPRFPTTTIGSFPQTDEVRKARAAHAKRALSDADYDAFLRKETEAAVRWQEEIGIDVLVHGEFERNDMVQYFGEQLAGYAFTKHAWVQSYGSRYVRPPIIFGDVSRPKPMTVEWSTLRSIADEAAHEGHADRSGDHAAMVLRAR